MVERVTIEKFCCEVGVDCWRAAREGTAEAADLARHQALVGRYGLNFQAA